MVRGGVKLGCQRTGHASSALFAIHKQCFASRLEQFQIGVVAWSSVVCQPPVKPCTCL